jgi:exopolyphosphatase / guanosine-5'-triphosphate,3'-diphosphate pyrophosphatase
MESIRRAVIDVGTNSVKLLVADVAGREVRPVSEQSKQTRLGHGFYETHRLRPEAIAATATAVANFVALANEAQVASIRVFATSAAREAVNREELTAAVERASGLRVEVISGEQEADWGFQGVTSDPELAQAPLLLMDVGGGSAQFILGRDSGKHARYSFPLGSVRLLETFPCSDPPTPAELAACRQWLKVFLQNEVRPQLFQKIADPKVGRAVPSAPRAAEDVQNVSVGTLPSGALGTARPTSKPFRAHALTSAATKSGGEVQLVGVGGTATILGCMEAKLETFDRARIEATRLSAERVTWHLERLWSLPLEARKKIVGLPKNRADVILMGVAIYQAVMEEFGFRELRISTRGLRFAALMSG